MKTRTAAIALGLLVLTGIPCRASQGGGVEAEQKAYTWFSVPIEVGHLGSGAEFVPVSSHVDFSEMVTRLGASGVVDEHSLRLFRVREDGTECSEAVQFDCDPQPRIRGVKKLADTPAGVSYLGEYPAGQTPKGLKVAGELKFVARGDREGKGHYRLEFGIRRDGIVIQAPFAPQNLKVFDAQGRATPVKNFQRMQIRPDRPINRQVDVFDVTRQITTYHLGPTSAKHATEEGAFRRPFCYPVCGPDGYALTNFGKPHDPTGTHAHHYSLWVAHQNVGGVDFWSEKGGVIISDGQEVCESGPVSCRIVQNLKWMDGDKELMRERRTMVAFHTPDAYRILDFELELKPAGEEVVLGKTTFGFLAVRVAQSMTVFDGAGEIRNSRGDRNERGCHLKRADWLELSGPVDEGKWAGVAIFDHPNNPHHPTVWHCRNDGWACASFNGEESYTIRQGEKLQLKYRVLLHRGNAKDGEVEKRWTEYSAAPTVRMGDPAALAN
jgi:methane monooxygenase PmoA-like